MSCVCRQDPTCHESSDQDPSLLRVVEYSQYSLVQKARSGQVKG